MPSRDQEDLEAIEATLVEALSKRKAISFVTVFEGAVSMIAVGHTVVGIDLEDKRFATDCADEWLDFGEAYCLVWGADERVLSTADAKEAGDDGVLSLSEAEAALG